MNAKDWLDYGGLGLAALTVLSSLAFARWALGHSFAMMDRAVNSFSRMADMMNERSQGDRKDDTKC